MIKNFKIVFFKVKYKNKYFSNKINKNKEDIESCLKAKMKNFQENF